jgi:hypothetical protein
MELDIRDIYVMDSFSVMEKMMVAQIVGVDNHSGCTTVGDDACDCCGISSFVCKSVERLIAKMGFSKDKIMDRVMHSCKDNERTAEKVLLSISEDDALTDMEKVFVAYVIGRVLIGIINWGACPNCGSHSLEDIGEPIGDSGCRSCKYKCRDCCKILEHDEIGTYRSKDLDMLIDVCNKINESEIFK